MRDGNKVVCEADECREEGWGSCVRRWGREEGDEREERVGAGESEVEGLTLLGNGFFDSVES